MKKQVMILRADSGPAIGAGHAMRCLALAQAWEEAGGTARFTMAETDSAFAGRLAAEGIACDVLGVPIASEADAEATCRLAREHRAAWLVIDGYRFGSGYQRALRGGAWRVMQIDDYGQSDRFEVDALLNQNIYATPEMYAGRVPSGAELLLGSRFVLLRREFWRFRGTERRHSGQIRRIVVTMGGSDPDNVTARVLEGMEKRSAPDPEIVVVVGGANPRREEIRRAMARMRIPGRLEWNVADMSRIFLEADLAVCAGGATCWEIAFLGLPMVTVVLAENQRRIAEGLAAAGISENLGDHARLSPERVCSAIEALMAAPERVAEMSRLGRRLIDGFGAGRVAERLALPAGGKTKV